MVQKVLIVEDQFLVAAATEDAVRELGYVIVGAAASRHQPWTMSARST
jgi:response regulator of citrate/malate metabolism